MILIRDKIQSKVYLVSGVHNDWKHTQKFLDCAINQSYKNTEIIIIDDGSTDDTYQKIKTDYPKVKIIKGNGSLWWTGCMFKAFEKVETMAKNKDFILTINNDCTFGRYYIENLLTTAKENPNCVIGSLALDNKNRNTIIDSGAKIDWLRGRVYGAGYKNQVKVPKNFVYDFDIDTLSTRGTLFPMPIVKKVGNFDINHFPHYVSDFEYVCRAKKKGVGLVVSYNCRIYNDKKRTGTSGPTDKPISLSELKVMLFGRKSQINIVDHFFFILLCCPWYLQPINYLYLIAKFIYLISFLPLFFPFRMPIVKIRSLLLS